MSEVIQIKDQHYILATSSLADGRRRVLKQGDTFAVFDRYGDIFQIGNAEQGVYHDGTRYVSTLRFKLGNDRPLLLSSSVKDDNAVVVVDLENPDIRDGDKILIPRGTVHFSRSKFLWSGRCYESCSITNYGAKELELDFTYEFAADFTDIFEVRGEKRAKRGVLLDPVVEADRVTLGYDGLDGVRRTTCITISPQPSNLDPVSARFLIRIKPKQQRIIYVTASCYEGRKERMPRYDAALEHRYEAMTNLSSQGCDVTTSNEQFNDWINRSYADLRMMITQTPHGPYPYAGIPWFSTPFGRDGIITALETLWVMPQMARGVLSYLAATQAQSEDAARDAEPGKILHERRGGEMAALGEIPFGCYYGSVDSTPLFVMLAGQYFRVSGDLKFIESIWPNIEAALQWIDQYGDRDGDGFVEYARRSRDGLANQGWKDSQDSVFHVDGRLAEGPIALCEVQGYVYDARREAAYLAALLGKTEMAARLEKQARTLIDRFESAFWCDDLSFYALGLDGDKKPCCVRTSNVGHCLYSGIVKKRRAAHVAEAIASKDFFSGWGIRTVSESQINYNPMSYHNGSIWPHDNALIAAGLAGYGYRHQAAMLLTGFLDASIFVDLHRLPELFCGFPRRPREGPTLYPVACAPQAWAAASVFLLLQSCVGLTVDASMRQARFDSPVLPEWLHQVSIKNLQVGDASVDVCLQRHPEDVSVNVTRRKGRVDILVRK